MASGMWLQGYSGQSTDQLLALSGEYRIDSIVLAFEEGLQARAQREGREALTQVERDVLAVEAYEREVNNGGHHQFFMNTPEAAVDIVSALNRIDCRRAAGLARDALRLAGVEGTVTIERLAQGVDAAGDGLVERLVEACDNPFYDGTEPIAERLFEYLRANRTAIRLP